MKPLARYMEISRDQSYAAVWDLQKKLQRKIIDAKRSGILNHENYLLLCEHNPVYTLGKSGKLDHLLGDQDNRLVQKPEFFKVNRGGDITYHGPGQITGYPILDMDQFYHDLHRYVRDIEEVIIKVLEEYSIPGSRIQGLTGVWVQDGPMNKKICAIGVHMSRWVSMHGFALNVNTDLDFYQGIVPCGIVDKDKTVTSLSEELGKTLPLDEVMSVLREKFKEVFDLEWA